MSGDPRGTVAPSPALGPTPAGGELEFAVHARAHRRLEIEAFEVGGSTPVRRLALERDPPGIPGFDIWRGRTAGLPERFEYVIRVDGGAALLDPYAPCLAGGETWGRGEGAAADRVGRRYRGLWFPEAVERSAAGRPPAPVLAPAERVVYEVHVRGFTRHPSSSVRHPGTYDGLIEKIPYLRSLGVTVVELLPVFEFDETENPRRNPETGERLLNFWGYSPVSFFAPKAGYATRSDPGAAVGELRRAIDELHRAGIAVVLDVVYNHTAEGRVGSTAPVHSLRGLDERAYYLHDTAGRPADVTGCGNTINANHPVVRRLIVDSLVHWREVYGVDGFRFDLAAFFYRGEHGRTVERPPILDDIAAEARLAGVWLVAEPWDVTGFTPPGGFPAPWAEWNGGFRDDVRRLFRGDPVEPRTVALRLAGSPDRFPPPRSRHDAVDFVACHDGHPLADLVAYERKHNAANGEGNRDGADHDLSFNCGVEGPSDDPAVRALRERQVRNLLAMLFATGGTPLLLAGDERGRTQRGNNNAWCQDNEIGWIDWGAGEPDRVELVRRGFALRCEIAGLSRGSVAVVLPFAAPGASSAAALSVFRDPTGRAALAIAVNPTHESVRLPLPIAPEGRSWALALDTSRPDGEAIPIPDKRPRFSGYTSEVELAPHSVRLLIGG